MKFNGVEITEASIQAARQWFADNAQARGATVFALGGFILVMLVRERNSGTARRA